MNVETTGWNECAQSKWVQQHVEWSKKIEYNEVALMFGLSVCQFSAWLRLLTLNWLHTCSFKTLGETARFYVCFLSRFFIFLPERFKRNWLFLSIWPLWWIGPRRVSLRLSIREALVGNENEVSLTSNSKKTPLLQKSNQDYLTQQKKTNIRRLLAYSRGRED